MTWVGVMMMAAGTIAALLSAVLLLWRVDLNEEGRVAALITRWRALSMHDACLVLVPLMGVAAACLAGFVNETSRRAANVAPAPIAGETSSTGGDTGENAEGGDDLAALRAYAQKLDGGPAAGPSTPGAAQGNALPDVNTMIGKLVARLQKEPNDVKGWKMLGWSYLNMNQPDEAVQAYETALKLQPDDAEAKQALEQAKSGQGQTAASKQGSDATAGAAPDAQRDSMVRGMVDQLAQRLEKSPNDEEGWMRLMRSRVTLGETDAAKAAFKKALSTFASDAGATSRLTAAARQFGIAENAAP